MGVVKKAPVVRRGGSKTNVGASAQSFSSKIVSKENWLVQAVGLLGNLGKSTKVRPVVDSDLSRANLVSCSSSTVGTATVGIATVGTATVGTATVGIATVLCP